MTYFEIEKIIEECAVAIGKPDDFAYYQFDEGSAPELPYILFHYPNNDDFYADDWNYSEIKTLTLEFYSARKDFEKEKAIENVLKSHELTYARSEVYISKERMYEVIYELEVLINE